MAAPSDVVYKFQKPRVYVALYALDGALHEKDPSGPDDYYWALIIAPKDAPKGQECVRYRIKKREEWQHANATKLDLKMMVWEYEKCLVPLGRHDDIVARVLVAKVEDMNGMNDHIELATPEKTMHVPASGKARTSKDWVQRIVEGLGNDSPGSGGVKHLIYNSYGQKLSDWLTIENCCTVFAKKVVGEDNARRDTVPTYNLLKNQEVSEKS